MKRSLMLLGVAAALAITRSMGHAHGEGKQTERKELIFASADDAKFTEIRSGGPLRAVLWGDPQSGSYGAFIKFKPAHDSGIHTHTHDVLLVVLKGAYLYKDDAGEKRVVPGSFLRIPGGMKHWVGGDAKEGTLFYSESTSCTRECAKIH